MQIKIGKWKIEAKDFATILDRKKYLELGGTMSVGTDVLENYDKLLNTQIATIEAFVTKIQKGDEEVTKDFFFKNASEFEVAEVFAEIQTKQADKISKKKKS